MKRAALLRAALMLVGNCFWTLAGENPGAFRIQLAMSTAAVASTAVESAATAAVESITAVIAAARVAAVVSATDKAVGFATPVPVASVSIATAASVVSTVAVVTAATVESAAIVAAVEPRAGADEDAADEVIRAVEAVGCAGVGIVAVVTISAGGCWPDRAVHGTYSNAHGKLCLSVSRSKKQNSQQCNIF